MKRCCGLFPFHKTDAEMMVVYLTQKRPYSKALHDLFISIQM